VDRIVAVVLDHVEATEQGGGLSRAQAADARSLKRAATALGVHLGTGDSAAPEVAESAPAAEPASVHPFGEAHDDQAGAA
jgi:hypothetical protein